MISGLIGFKDNPNFASLNIKLVLAKIANIGITFFFLETAVHTSIKLNQLRSGQCRMCPDACDPLQLGSVGNTDYGFALGVHSCSFVTVEGQGHYHLSMETGTRGSSLNPMPCNWWDFIPHASFTLHPRWGQGGAVFTFAFIALVF